MARSIELRGFRQSIRREISDADAHFVGAVKVLREAADEAQEFYSGPFRDPLERLCNETERVAGAAFCSLKLVRNFESKYGDMIEELQKDMERVDFAARYRDFICLFEVGVFLRMKKLEKYKEALKAGADPLKYASEALELLAWLAQAENSQDDDVREVLTDGNKLVREAWNEAVVAKGLLLEEYVTLRELKGDTNVACFPKSESPEQALAELKKPLAVPEKCVPYKEPLVKLLELLTGAR